MQETGFCMKLDALSPSKAGSRDSSSWAKVLVCLSANEVVSCTKVG